VGGRAARVGQGSPMSASIMQQCGPGPIPANSITFTPASGPNPVDDMVALFWTGHAKVPLSFTAVRSTPLVSC